MKMTSDCARARDQWAHLDDGVRRRMEALFGADFSDVRIHVGGCARDLGAEAFACGSDLYFAPGCYDPATAGGLARLAHELTHVVQQRECRVPRPDGGGLWIVQAPHLEGEADRMGAIAARMACDGWWPVAPHDGYPSSPSAAPAGEGGVIQCRMEQDGSISGEGRNRPGEPQDWEKTDTTKLKWKDRPVPSNVKVDMTYHHIMPWGHIWKFWNVFLDLQAWDVFREWAYLLRIEEGIEDFITRASPDGGGVAAGVGGKSRDDVEMNICWSPWNLVEGPTHRTKGKGTLEDPGEDLDLHRKVSGNLRKRQHDISTLDGLMANCQRSVAALPRPWTKAQHQALMKDTDPIVRQLHRMRYGRNQALTQFDPRMWRLAKPNTTDSSGNLVSAPRYTNTGAVQRAAVWEKMPIL